MPSTKLQFPESSNTVRVRMIDTTAVMTIRAESFIKPVQPGHEMMNVTDVAFLIEHAPSGQKIMFDLGCRKDHWNLPAMIQRRLGVIIPSLKVDKDITEILTENDVDLKTITHAIWSHYHWDHVGNLSLFPSTTSLVVGPGFKSGPNILPGYPKVPESPVSASDFANRQLIEVDFNKNAFTIGDLPAYDFFGDGSFYLLDTPGHCIGHICGLARTTASPDSFVFMGGDICHFAGDFRPSAAIPLPDPINLPPSISHPIANPNYRKLPVPCPCALFTEAHPRDQTNAQTTPWYVVSDHPRSAYINPPVAAVSVSRMAAFDDDERVLVCLAHDTSLLDVLPILNKSPERDLNTWRKDGIKETVHWGWMRELPRDGVPAQTLIVEGFWRDGKKWDRETWLKEFWEKGVGKKEGSFY